MNDILFLPVKPKHADNIMSGKKTLELRKSEPRHEIPMTAVIYASSPRCVILGTVEWYGTICQGVVAFTEYDLARACVTRKELEAYYGKKTWTHSLCFRKATSFAQPIPLETMRARWHIEPPQQWRYIDAKTFDEIVEAGR